MGVPQDEGSRDMPPRWHHRSRSVGHVGRQEECSTANGGGEGASRLSTRTCSSKGNPQRQAVLGIIRPHDPRAHQRPRWSVRRCVA